MEALIVIIGVVQALGIGGYLFVVAKKSNSGVVTAAVNLEDEVAQKKQIKEKIEALQASMINISELKSKVSEFLVTRESLKAERGRVTITQAELETIEVRLRELDEIARELEASMTETKEELKILQRKEKDLSNKNDALKAQISGSLAKIDEILSQIELTAQMQEQIARAKTELGRTEQQIENLLTQIQAGNEQYFILKKRFDALDIEYAQLYEKFAESGG
jgi:chromosome segregation ATPase